MSSDGPLRVSAASRLHLGDNADQDEFSVRGLRHHRLGYISNLVMCRHS
jgi:hypothetical protein